MKKIAIVAFAVLSVAQVAVASDYTVTVASGVTNTVDDAFVTDLGSADRLVKRGEGVLELNDKMKNYAGEIVAEEGVLLAKVTGSFGTSAGATVVSNGASVVFKATNKDNCKFYSETFKISGSGATGENGAFVNLGVGLTGNNLRYITMLDDATIYAWGEMALYAGVLDMNGKTLTLIVRDKTDAGQTSWSYSLSFTRSEVKNPGHIILERGRFMITGQSETLKDGKAWWNGDASNTLTVKKPGRLCFASSYTYLPWTVVFEKDSGAYVSGDYRASSPTNNAVFGPLTFNGSASLSYGSNTGTLWANGGLAGSGTASVGGGTKLQIAGTSAFTGKLIASGTSSNGYLPVTLHSGSALGSACAEARFVEADLPLLGDTAYALPRLVFSNTTARTVSGATAGGTVAEFVKDGSGQLDYFAFAAPAKLAVRQGTLRLVGQRLSERMQIGGVLEGEFSTTDSTYQYPGANYYWSNYSRTFPAATSRLDSVHYAYTTAQPLWATKHAIARYEGYIWNDTDEDVVWSFMSGCQNRGRMYINDKLLFDQSSYQRAAFAQATLKPGANKFVYSIFFAPTTTGGGGGSTLTDVIDYDGTTTTSDSRLKWVKLKGCAYNPNGTKSYDEADFLKFENLADGALLTVTNTIAGLRPASRISLGDVAVSTDAVLDLNSADTVYTCSSVAANGTVKNGILSITNRIVVTASEIAGGASLALQDASLEFTSDAIDDVDDVSAMSPRGEEAPYVLVSNPTAFATTPAVSAALAAKRWRTALSADGKSLLLYREPKGMAMLFR